MKLQLKGVKLQCTQFIVVSFFFVFIIAKNEIKEKKTLLSKNNKKTIRTEMNKRIIYKN